MASIWNPWHGCHKISPGCKHCYVYRGDAKRGVDSSVVSQTQSFDLPVRRKRNGEYKLPSGTEVMTCFTSDFFVEEADIWRERAWEMIREREDLDFFMITKRIDRVESNLPADWGEGYEHVKIYCTVENQQQADYRLSIYKDLPVKHKGIICEPLLEEIDISRYLEDEIESVVAGGESGAEARECHFEWILKIREVCIEKNISFWFKQTGARFMKEGKLYKVPRRLQHSQARKANINFDRN